MNDYTFDPDAAAAELARANGITNDVQRRDAVQRIGVFALIDIAASLQILAAEAAIAMGAGATEPPEPEPVTDATRDFLIVGDLVHLVGETDPLEVTKIGFDQGEAYADVVGPDGTGGRYYVRNLERIIGDEGQAEADVEIVSEAIAEAYLEADDIDAEFDGDNANEAARKAAKKKGTKK